MLENSFQITPKFISKIVVESWSYLPEGGGGRGVRKERRGDNSEIQEIFSKQCEKSKFSIEILI